MLPDSRTRIRTACGEVVGGIGAHGCGVWLGIPYAAAPVKELRWKAPRPPAPWNGLRETLYQKSGCAQPAPKLWLQPNEQDSSAAFVGSEDCLYLNVWAPLSGRGGAVDPAAGMPVMVWIHGGGNSFSDCSVYDGAILAAKDVVVVTLNYRLGALGWFSHQALREAADCEDDRSANFGLLDIIQALKWIQENIRSFGGDPNNVTLFGESGGGTNVLALIASPRARGLFHRAIAQSGNISAVSQRRTEGYFEQEGIIRSSAEILVQLLINDGRAVGRDEAKRLVESMGAGETLDYLRGKTPGEINQTYAQLFDFHKNSSFIFENITALTHQTLILDDVVLPRHGLLRQFAATPSVPVMLGTTRDEDNLLLAEDPHFVSYSEDEGLRIRDVERFRLAGEILTALWRANGSDEPAVALSQGGGSVFVYRFDWDEVPPFAGPDREPYGAAHGADVKFLFGSQVEALLNDTIDYEAHPTFNSFGETLRSYWIEFAKVGAPGKGTEGDLPLWESWRGEGREGRFMILDSADDGGCRMATGILTKAGVLQGFKDDPRMNAEQKKEFMEVLLRYPYHWGRLTIEDLRAFE